MRIAFSAENASGLESVVAQHFGRCPYFVVVDLGEGGAREVKVVPNPAYEQHQPGQVPAFINSLGADVMVTGGMGSRAVAFFQDYGIQAVTGATGNVGQALEQYLKGELAGAGPCRQHHGDSCQ